MLTNVAYVVLCVAKQTSVMYFLYNVIELTRQIMLTSVTYVGICVAKGTSFAYCSD